MEFDGRLAEVRPYGGQLEARGGATCVRRQTLVGEANVTCGGLAMALEACGGLVSKTLQLEARGGATCVRRQTLVGEANVTCGGLAMALEACGGLVSKTL
ncbi:hypothetical protein GOBAR_DD05325 [Gossypium barbadense]|nr:hypothetical protein GOBAR_DD05325 [Gossypium barbadense]